MAIGFIFNKIIIDVNSSKKEEEEKNLRESEEEEGDRERCNCTFSMTYVRSHSVCIL